ncbi:MAG: glycoside hydrolase family 15 protein [Halococcoides sp.]
MRLTTALNDYKRSPSERFPEEHRTIRGAFSGYDDRLVHVDPDGSIRDYSSPLAGLYGIDRSQFGIETDDGVHWFEGLDTIRQHYYRETRLVETEYDAGSYTVHQYDLTLGRAHVTHVELRGSIPTDARLVAFVTMAPEGSEGGVGALIHDDGGPDGTQALEVFHRREHDYLAASTGLDAVRGQRPEQFEELLDDAPVSFPRGDETRSYDQTRLTGDFVVTAPLERAGRGSRTTLVSQLSDHREIDRGTALADLRRCAIDHDSADSLRSAARDRTVATIPSSVPRSELVRSDLRVLDLLSVKSGGHVAAPEFDTFFANSGGYGFVWFRDDAAIADHYLAAGDHFDLPVIDAAERSARFHCRQQLPDGTWPHRVWAADGSLAPGWANARVERNDESVEYQADQTATVTAFLATLLDERHSHLDEEVTAEIRSTIDGAIDAIERDLADNGLPAPCQNVWEDTIGQFCHTAAETLRALALVADAPVSTPLRERARSAAETVRAGIERLWDDDRGAYAMALVEGDRLSRIDVASVAIVEAMLAYDRIADDADLDRLRSHLATTIETLFRDPDGPVAGLIRYEDDRWRRAEQSEPKIWSVATLWAAFAAARLGTAFESRDRDGSALFERAAGLYELADGDGPLTTDAGYLAEQVFDDGTLDSASPLGWSHALRLRVTALLDQAGALPSGADIEGPAERPTWTTGEKFGVLTAADHGADDPSRVWATLTRGAVTEVRFPRVDLMNLRTLDFLVRSVEDATTTRTHRETRRADDGLTRRVEPRAEESLRFAHVFEADDGQGHDWELTVEYATDPAHDALVADLAFEAHDDRDYEVYAVADIALTNSGSADRGIRLGEDGRRHLAARDPTAYTGDAEEALLADESGDAYSVAVAMAAENRFDWATVASAGSDELRALFRDGIVPEPRDAIDGANVVLLGRLGTGVTVEERLALGFARYADTAAALGAATGALDRGFETVRAAYDDTWTDRLSEHALPASVADDAELAAQYRTSLASLFAVGDKTFHGASIASPSVPWGVAVTADEPRGYGYNFVWSRDLYQVFTVFETIGALDVARSQLEYIYEYQQDESGFIPQNTYVNGITRWGGEQMDTISFPQVMAYHLFERGVGFEEVAYEYEHVRRSARYVAFSGPESAQERWEEEAGYSPSTIATEIAGLVCASHLAAATGREADALVWQAIADDWAARVEEWTATTTGTEHHHETPYYVRITRDGDPDAGTLRTLANDGPTLDERDVIDAGFLELVRLGVRPADHPVVGNSVREVDATIRVDVGSAAGFYRYNGDGYGERERGDKGGPWSPDNSGKGRLWPLLTGERGEYELRADDPDLGGRNCLAAMAEFANSGRMIAEQVWDREVETEYGWEFGEGTGSATPLAWSMAQYVRLAHGVSAGEPVETPAVVRERYVEQAVHDRSGPSLRVDVRYQGNAVVVSGETTGDRVAVSTPADSHLLGVEDGAFEGTVEVGPGETEVVVAASAGDNASTTVDRFHL